MDKKTWSYGLLGCILLLVAIEQIIADVIKLHVALNSWLSFIILLIGIFFIERAIKQRKKEKK